MERSKRINLPKSKKARLRRVFGVSNVTVWSALNYLTNSELAGKIRAAALADGGTVEHSVVVPEGFIADGGTVEHSVVVPEGFIADGGTVEHSVVVPEGFIADGGTVEHSMVVPEGFIADGGTVEHSVVVPEGFIADCRTDFVHGADGRVCRIIQLFSNGVRVEFDNDACRAVIFCRGKAVRNYEQVVMRDWGNIVFEAQRLSDASNGGGGQ